MAVSTLKFEARLDTGAVGRMKVGAAGPIGALTHDGDMVRFDLSELNFLSSMSIRLIVIKLKQFRQRGVAVDVISPREPTLKKVRRVSDLARYLNLWRMQRRPSGHLVSSR